MVIATELALGGFPQVRNDITGKHPIVSFNRASKQRSDDEFPNRLNAFPMIFLSLLIGFLAEIASVSSFRSHQYSLIRDSSGFSTGFHAQVF